MPYGPKQCEVCAATFSPKMRGQRSCGRVCGRYIQFGYPQCAVDWRHCEECDRPVTTGSKHRHPRPVKDRTWMTTPIECPACGDYFTNPHTTIAVHCSRRCSRKASKLRRRVREARTYGEWRWSDFMRMARAFDYCCAYCGKKPDRLDPDHVVPLSKGGPNILGNLLPTCSSCNSDKQAFTLDEWATRLAAQGRTRHTTWHPDDRRYWHLTVNAHTHSNVA